MRRFLTTALFILVVLWMTGCSSLAYVTGYNMVSDQQIEVTTTRPDTDAIQVCPACGWQAETSIGAEEFKCPKCGYSNANFSEAAYVIAMVETGGGYLRKSPTLVIGIALAPIFFIVGTVSGAFDSTPGAPPPPEPQPVDKVASRPPKVLCDR